MVNLKDFRNAVIIADSVEIDRLSVTQFSTDIDRATKKNVESLRTALDLFFDDVIVYTDPQEFRRNITKHKKDLIWPYWHGSNSRNKQAKVPALCELENLYYVGGDAATNALCTDKVKSLDFCTRCGVKRPKHKIIHKPDAHVDWEYNLPLVVKPIYEGTSIGITSNNLTSDPDQALDLARKLCEKLNQPIILEEFIPGKEVNIVIIGSERGVSAWSAVERCHESDPDYFNSNLYTFEHKIKTKEIRLTDARHLLSDRIKSKVFRLFEMLGKTDYIRIDGKLWEDEFWCFELSHDTSLSPNGGFFAPFQYIGLDFANCVKTILDTCLEHYNNLLPNQ